MAPTPIGTAKAIIMRDPDGYFIEAIQATPAIIAATDAQPARGGGRGRQGATPPQPSQIVGAVMGLTVRDMDETLKYWNGVLAMEMPQATAFADDQPMLDEIDVDLESPLLVGDRSRRESGRRHVEGDMPRMVEPRTLRKPDLADDLRPSVQRWVGVAPRVERQARPGFGTRGRRYRHRGFIQRTLEAPSTRTRASTSDTAIATS